MTQYAGNSAVYPTTYTIVSDNTPRAAVSVNVALEALGDRTAYINARFVNGVDGGTYAGPLSFTNIQLISGTGSILLNGGIVGNDIVANASMRTPIIRINSASETVISSTSAVFNSNVTLKGGSSVLLDNNRSYTRVLHSPFYFEPGEWQYGIGAHRITNLTSGGTAYCLLDIPEGAVLQTLRVWVEAATGHGVLPIPAQRMYLGLNRMDKFDGTITNIFTNVADPSATVGAYEAYHSIERTGINHTMDKTVYRYHVVIGAESGGSFIPGAVAYAVEAFWTRALIGEE